MSKNKKSVIWLVLSIILFVGSLIPIFVCDEYDYNKIDLTKPENQVAIVGELTYDVYPGITENNIDFEFTLFNLTENTLEDVTVYIIMRNSRNEEEVFYTDPYSLSSRNEVDKDITGECDSVIYTSAKIYVKIGEAELFELQEIDELVDTNPIVNISAILLVVFFITTTIMIVRVCRSANKKQEIDQKAYETKVNELADLELQKERTLLEREQLTNDILRQNAEKANQPKTVTCEYCGCQSDASQDRCNVCGAILKK